MLRLLAALAFAGPATAPAAPDPCPCLETLEWTVAKVEANYAGFGDKITLLGLEAYRSALAAARDDARRATDDLRCHEVLRRYLRFFEDGHLNVSLAGGPADTGAAAIRGRFAGAPRRELTEAQARVRLARGRRDPLEGIWRSFDPGYRIAIIRDSARSATRDGFIGVVLEADGVWWVPGQIKLAATKSGAGYRAVYYMRDHSTREWTLRPVRDLLLLNGVPAFVREYPATAPVDTAAIRAQLNVRTGLRRLSDSTLLLQLPSFGDEQARAVDSVLAANREALLATPNLIIDVRGNGGGSDYVYGPVIDWLYTDPIRMVNSNLLATPDNIAKFATLAADTGFTEDQQEEFGKIAAGMRRVEGGWYERADYTQTRDTVYDSPRQVAVLTDRGCGSSCEQFVLAARQSRKVTLYGDNTAGILDYANVQRLRDPCGRFVLHYPTSRSRRLPHDPVDPHGIAPAVRVPPDELFPVEWVRRRLEAR